MWKHRSDVAREIAEVLSEHLSSGVRVIGLGEHAATMSAAAREVMKDDPRDGSETVLFVIDGIENVELVERAAREWREKGMKRIIVGVGIMPSHLLEPLKQVVDELFVLKIPRLFQTVGQYFEGID